MKPKTLALTMIILATLTTSCITTKGYLNHIQTGEDKPYIQTQVKQGIRDLVGEDWKVKTRFKGLKVNEIYVGKKVYEW